MKTADLIPLLLIELNESDKYGFELTKNIETKSHGKIVIKQPTLYTLLKKLEKSKFITSYWQDSDIGGKRHYYKITDNGKMQLSTLPSYDILMQNILNEETENIDKSDIVEENTTVTPNTNSINKAIENSNNQEPLTPTSPLETVLPKEEVFSNESIDTKTTVEINQNNADLLQNENLKNEEKFATNVVVAKFIEIKPAQAPEIKQETASNLNNLDNLEVKINTNQNDIKYAEYVNLKKSKEYQKSKLFSKLSIVRSILVSFFMIALLISFAILSKRFGTSALYYATLIVGLILAIFYPIITAINIDTIKAKFKQNNYKFSIKFSLITKLSVLCFILLVVLVVNISLKNNTFVKILTINNFANFYVPILFASSMFVDSLIANLISIKMNK